MSRTVEQKEKVPSPHTVRRRTIRSPKLSENIARDIVADIVATKAEPGDMLPPEAVMLAQYGVGRASLREALRILEVQGIVTIKPGPGGGPVVAGRGVSDYGRMTTLHLQLGKVTYRELLDARTALEPTLARLAAERTSAAVAAQLNDHLQLARTVSNDDAIGLTDVWADFHELIGSLAGNGVIDLFASTLQEIYRERVIYREQSTDRRRIDVNNRRISDQAHENIAKAIIQGKPQRAEQAMREHMTLIMAEATARQSVQTAGIITWHHV
jgi:DNA-binding FadR family transcriptional regulator